MICIEVIPSQFSWTISADPLICRIPHDPALFGGEKSLGRLSLEERSY